MYIGYYDHTNSSTIHTYKKTTFQADRCSKRYRTKWLRLLVIGVLMLAAFTSGAIIHAYAGDKSVLDPNTYSKVIVTSGDTLWRIADEYAPEHEDIRHYLNDLMKLNKLKSSTIQAGDVLLLPKRD